MCNNAIGYYQTFNPAAGATGGTALADTDIGTCTQAAYITGQQGTDECWDTTYPGTAYFDAGTLATEVPGCILDPTAPASNFAKCDIANGYVKDDANPGSCTTACQRGGF